MLKCYQIKLVSCICFGLLVVGFWWFFPTRSVVVLGKFSWLNQQVIFSEVKQKLFSGFFRLDLPSMRQSLLMVNGIEDAHIWRCWPGDLIIKIKTREPKFRFENGGFIDAKGVLFYPYGQEKISSQLPIIATTIDRISIAVDYFTKLQKGLKSGYVINKLIDDPDIGWQLVLDHNIILVLGNDKVFVKLKKLMNKINQVRRKKNVLIDLRYLNGFAIKKLH